MQDAPVLEGSAVDLTTDASLCAAFQRTAARVPERAASPANIEGKLKDAHPLIAQVAIIGDGRPDNVALLVPDSHAAAYAAKSGRAAATLAELADDPSVQSMAAEGVAAANELLSRVEQIKRYELLRDEWMPGSDELTPTVKLKRKPISAKYEANIQALYDAPRDGQGS